MGRKHVVIALTLLAAGFAVVADGQPKTGPGGFTELQRETVEGANLEIVMGLVERSGKSTSAKHYHPGGEFGFVLEGAATVATESEPRIALEAGDSFYQPPGQWHVVSTATGGAKTVVFRVIKKGDPMIVVVD